MKSKIKTVKNKFDRYFAHKEMIYEKNNSVLKVCCIIYMGVLLFYTLFELFNLRMEDNVGTLLLLYGFFDILNAVFCIVFLRKRNNASSGKANAVYCTIFEVTLLVFFVVEGGCVYPDRVSMYIPLAIMLIIALFSHTPSYSIIMIVGYTVSFIILVQIFKQPEIAWFDIQIAVGTMFSSLICYLVTTSLRIREYEAIEKSMAASKAKSEFLSQMSHDLRTPMNGILGLAELSKNEYNVDVLRRNMSQIQVSGQYLLSIINEILDYQRIESGKLILEPQVVSIQSLLDSVLDIVRTSIEKKNIELKVANHDADLSCEVRLDPVRFKQVLINLLSNAIKFTPDGGTVEITFELAGQDKMNNNEIIIITDTGIGMSEDFIENKIFHPFSQESNTITSNYVGSGLGLSIVKSIIEAMGGTISVESELGVGTKFTNSMDFERVDPQEAETVKEKDKTNIDDVTAILEGKHILVAEDHPLNAQIIIKLLETVGCVVTWAKDGKECSQIFIDSEPGLFDAILMDIRMSIMDGLHAAEIIRSQSRDDAKTIPIIAMTANAYEEDKKKSLDAGIDSHLAKPVNSSLLYETLCKYVKMRCL